MSEWDKAKIVGLVVLVCLLIPGCQPCETGREKIEALLQELPIPEAVVLIERADGVEVGSERGCVWSYTELLYGTTQPAEEVAEFYQSWMMSRGRYDEPFDDAYVVYNADGLSIGLSLDVTVALKIPYAVIQKARSDFRTVYKINITYAPPSTWEHCSVVELPTPQPQ